MRQQWADYRVFWREFRQAYHSTGAVLPSGRALAAALCRYVQVVGENASVAGRDESATAIASPPRPRRILEVGPGTGAVTGRIIRTLQHGDLLVLVERNDMFVDRLRARLADEPLFRSKSDRLVLLHSDVEDIAEEPPFDLIISGLPLNNFSVELMDRVLDKLRRLLAPGGTLSFFEYVAVRRAKALISSRAERLRLRDVGRVMGEMLRANEIHRDLVLANVPPAWVHHVRFGG